ncbi:MAG: DUF4258 domain-containing protein [Bacteroidota bacterium]
MKKAFPYILLAVLAIGAIFIKRCRNESGGNKKATTDNIDRNNGLDRRLSFLEYTDHAKCRMQCEHISTQTIETGLQNWQIDTAASEFTARPCPIYALQGYSVEKQHLRIIFGQCDFKTKVITCINIDSVFDCHCPGVGIKYER